MRRFKRSGKGSGAGIAQLAWAQLAWLGLAATLAAGDGGSPACGLPNPVFQRFGDAVTLWQGFDHGAATAGMAGGAAEPLSVKGTVAWNEGMYGRALRNGEITYKAADNLDLRRAGTLLFWMSPYDWVRDDDEPCFYPLYVFGEKGFIMFGRQGLIMKEGVLKRGDMFFAHIEGGGKQFGQIPFYGASRSWKNGEWHLVVLTWRLGQVGLSLDGCPPEVACVPDLGRAGRFVIGCASLPEKRQILIDEFIVLDRQLSPQDIAWLYETTPRLPSEMRNPNLEIRK